MAGIKQHEIAATGNAYVALGLQHLYLCRIKKTNIWGISPFRLGISGKKGEFAGWHGHCGSGTIEGELRQ